MFLEKIGEKLGLVGATNLSVSVLKVSGGLVPGGLRKAGAKIMGKCQGRVLGLKLGSTDPTAHRPKRGIGAGPQGGNRDQTHDNHPSANEHAYSHAGKNNQNHAGRGHTARTFLRHFSLPN
jgi:hypothetical protein